MVSLSCITNVRLWLDSQLACVLLLFVYNYYYSVFYSRMSIASRRPSALAAHGFGARNINHGPEGLEKGQPENT